MKKLTRTQLRTLIEAEVDTERLPRGPNSRDDAEDKPLKETDMVPEGLDVPELDRLFLKEETHPVYGFIATMAAELTTAMNVIDSCLPSQGDKWLTDELYDALDKIDSVKTKLLQHASSMTKFG